MLIKIYYLWKKYVELTQAEIRVTWLDLLYPHTGIPVSFGIWSVASTWSEFRAGSGVQTRPQPDQLLWANSSYTSVFKKVFLDLQTICLMILSSLVQTKFGSQILATNFGVFFMIYVMFQKYVQCGSNNDVTKYCGWGIHHNWDMSFGKFEGLPT